MPGHNTDGFGAFFYAPTQVEPTEDPFMPDALPGFISVH
jgi:hypothetical protein